MENLNYFNLISLINQINKKLATSSDPEFEDNDISELQMHKILYILYGGFYATYQKELFSPNFEAWRHGPVEIDYRKAYKNQINLNEIDKFEININLDELRFLKSLIRKTLNFSAWSLVQFTHNTEAWSSNYNENNRKCKPIPAEEIKKSFKTNWFN